MTIVSVIAKPINVEYRSRSNKIVIVSTFHSSRHFFQSFGNAGSKFQLGQVVQSDCPRFGPGVSLIKTLLSSSLTLRQISKCFVSDKTCRIFVRPIGRFVEHLSWTRITQKSVTALPTSLYFGHTLYTHALMYNKRASDWLSLLIRANKQAYFAEFGLLVPKSDLSSTVNCDCKIKL